MVGRSRSPVSQIYAHWQTNCFHPLLCHVCCLWYHRSLYESAHMVKRACVTPTSAPNLCMSIICFYPRHQVTLSFRFFCDSWLGWVTRHSIALSQGWPKDVQGQYVGLTRLAPVPREGWQGWRSWGEIARITQMTMSTRGGNVGIVSVFIFIYLAHLTHLAFMSSTWLDTRY